MRAQGLIAHALIGAVAAVGLAYWLDRRAQRRHEEVSDQQAEWNGILDEMTMNTDALRRTVQSVAKGVDAVTSLVAHADQYNRERGRTAHD